MAIAYRSTSSVTEFGGTTSIVVDKPAGVVSGDVMCAIVIIYDNAAADVTTPPTGWTLVAAGSVAVGNLVQRAYIKVAGGSEPTTYTWVINNFDVCNIGVGAWSGVDNSTPQDTTATGSTGTGTNRTATGVTTVTNDAWIVVMSTGYAQALSAGFSGMTQRLVWDTRSYIYDQTIAVAGATGNKAATSAADANGWTTVLIALRPSGGAATPTGFMTTMTRLWGT